MKENLLLNKLGSLKYHTGNWEENNPKLGQFPDQLAGFIDRHAEPSAQIIIVDSDSGNSVRFCREMAELGYGFTTRRADNFMENGDPFKGRFLQLRSLRFASVSSQSNDT